MDSRECVDSEYSIAEDEVSDAEKMPMLSSSGKRASTRGIPRALWAAVALIVSLLTANATLLSIWIWALRNVDSTCLQHMSAVWSPIMDEVPLRYEPVRFEGNPFEQSRYTQDPGPEVDQAWADLGIHYKYTAIVPEERGLEAGIDPSSIKVNASLGGGYITTVRVLHQLHCLNMLRQSLPWNVEYYRSRKIEPWHKIDPIVRHHLNHCLDMIRQQIQCESDVGMFAARWVKEEDKDINFIPSFNSMHMCRNFDDVLEWVSSHQRDKTRTPEIRDDDVVLTDPRDAYI